MKEIVRLHRAKTGLVVIDIQEKLLPAIFENDRLIENALRLIRGAQILGISIFVTEQYRKGLGLTVRPIAEAIPGIAPAEKFAFSSCGAEGFVESLKAKKVSDVILCGMESHVCVSQTCLDLLGEGFNVFVAADAVSSRTADNHRVGIERMRTAGAVIVSTEMALFELLEKAGTEEFKKVLALVK